MKQHIVHHLQRYKRKKRDVGMAKRNGFVAQRVVIMTLRKSKMYVAVLRVLGSSYKAQEQVHVMMNIIFLLRKMKMMVLRL